MPSCYYLKTQSDYWSTGMVGTLSAWMDAFDDVTDCFCRSFRTPNTSRHRL